MELSIAPTPAAPNGGLFHMEPPGFPPDPACHEGAQGAGGEHVPELW